MASSNVLSRTTDVQQKARKFVFLNHSTKRNSIDLDKQAVDVSEAVLLLCRALHCIMNGE